MEIDSESFLKVTSQTAKASVAGITQARSVRGVFTLNDFTPKEFPEHNMTIRFVSDQLSQETYERVAGESHQNLEVEI
jgi:hypothetical protein